VVLRDGDAAAATGGDDPRRAGAERVQRHGGRAAILRPQAEPCGDERGGQPGVLSRHAIHLPFCGRPAGSRSIRTACPGMTPILAQTSFFSDEGWLLFWSIRSGGAR